MELVKENLKMAGGFKELSDSDDGLAEALDNSGLEMSVSKK